MICNMILKMSIDPSSTWVDYVAVKAWKYCKLRVLIPLLWQYIHCLEPSGGRDRNDSNEYLKILSNFLMV